MYGMNMFLPPFAPDYGGVCSVLYGGDGMAVIHDASGCTINFTSYDEPRYIKKPSKIFCSNLRELDAILGDDEKLVNKVLFAAESLKPRFIALVGSSVPMLIGTDLKGIAKEVEYKSGIKTFGFETSGIGLYDKGASDAQLALIKEYFEPEEQKHGVALLGDDAISMSGEANRRLVEERLSENGVEVIASIGQGDCFEDIKKAGRAEAMLAVSSTGVAAAKYLKKKYGIPYVVGMPLGEKSAAKLCDNIRAAIKGEEIKAHEKGEMGRILILGDSVIASSLCDTLYCDYGIKGAVVGDIFSNLCPEYSDISLSTEKDAQCEINSGKYDAVIADPVFSSLIRGETELIPMPCTAVSGGIYGEMSGVYTKEKLDEIADKLRKGLKK